MSTVNAYSGDTAHSLDATDALSQTRTRVRPTRIERNPPHAAALASLALAYALSWAELGLAATIGLPGDAGSHPFAASVVARVLVGLLYLCVAARLQWARWVTIALGFASVALVAPTLALQWETFPAAAVVSGVALVCRLSASLFLLAPSVDVSTKAESA
ncbi:MULTISPECIES: hypothetical protein [unclassified Caballeronia]|uniref:hypothetical protein n=1 Tax=unclassified Caballeronia TaxID=2646786 RepID=UPI002859BB7A|nr:MULTISPECIES: hypothetical protein [unclassified Caballeronia]MDR5754747.1 hypothetical protein [Caballeronia sp. LZ024]MDR5839751.1 hypothetical protein [Caballeronia sp. LZ031]